MTDGRITPTSPARELANIEHRRRILERALADEPLGSRAQRNAAELAQLEEQHAAWSEEIEANREAWIQHFTRQRRVHQELARRAIFELQKLQGGAISDQPSTNGKAHS